MSTLQTINYAAIPGLKAHQYIHTIVEMYRFIKDQEPDYRGFLRYLRSNDLYDKETFELLWSFVGIDAKKGKPLKVGAFPKKLFESTLPEDRHKLVFSHLSKRNEILIKYVMDGLNERLYSTNELYRFITSYVYPGAYITLVNFRNWMAWLEASQHIKMIGIRWGLSELGEEAMNYVKTIDVDEILEEEEELEEMGEDAEDDDEEMEVVGASSDEPDADTTDESEPEPAPAPKSEPAAPAPAPSRAAPENVVQLPTQQSTPRMAAPPSVQVPLDVETVRVIVQPVERRTDGAPLKLVQEAFAAADEGELDEFGEESGTAEQLIGELRLDEEIVAENLRAVLSSWQGRPGAKLLRASDYGLTLEGYQAEPAYTVFRLSCLAVNLFRFQGRLNVGKGGESFAMLDQMGLFSNLFKSSTSVDDILAELFAGGLDNRPEVFSNLHFYLLFRRALRPLGDEGITRLSEIEDPGSLAGELWHKLGHFSLHYEILWIQRELFLLGAWENERLAELGVVPLPTVRDHAFRLGFLETPYAADFPSLVAISRRLSQLFPKESHFEAPLVHFRTEPSTGYDRGESPYFTRDQLGV